VVDDDGPYLSPDGFGRRGSVQAHSPSQRRDTFRRPRDPAIERLVRSRASSTTSRSTSPPNSVDAFAGPNRRRERANTANSRPPSFVELNLQRTHSRATARRPTISDERPEDVKSIKTVSAASSAEEDVCFPVEEDFGKTTRFDYEELEEFVAECQERTPIAQNLRHKPSVASQMSKKIFSDLRPKSSQTHRKDDIEIATLKDVDPAIQEKLAEEGLAHMYNENKKDVPVWQSIHVLLV
jgi:magnesium transporter